MKVKHLSAFQAITVQCHVCMCLSFRLWSHVQLQRQPFYRLFSSKNCAWWCRPWLNTTNIVAILRTTNHALNSTVPQHDGYLNSRVPWYDGYLQTFIKMAYEKIFWNLYVQLCGSWIWPQQKGQFSICLLMSICSPTNLQWRQRYQSVTHRQTDCRRSQWDTQWWLPEHRHLEGRQHCTASALVL